MAKKKQTDKRPTDRKQKPSIFEHRHFALMSLGILALGVIFLFRDFLFSNKMLYGSDMLSAGIFFRSYFVEFVHNHWAVPQWNPYIFGGMPFVDAFHGDLFYPLSFLKFFGQLYRMLGMNLVLHIFLAGLFMYFCARQFKLSRLASIFSASSYMFAPYLVSLIAPGHDGKIYVTALFPVAIMFLERGFESKTWMSALFNFSIMGAAIGFIVLSPHPQMSYFTLWALGAYSLYRLIYLFVEQKSVLPLIRPASLALYAVLIGLALSAIQFYPGYIYTTEYSPRADAKKGWEWATSWSMHQEEAASLIIPEFAGTSGRDGSSVYWGKNFFKDNSESVSVVSLLVALLGLFFSKRRHRYYFGGMALVALLYALGSTTPVFKIFFYLIPKVSSMRAASMIMFLFSFSISLLAGMGLQWLLDQKEASESAQRKLQYLLLGFPALLLVIALGFSASGQGMINTWVDIFYSKAANMQVQQGITKLDLAYRNLPAVQSGAWFAFLFVAATVAIIMVVRKSRSIGLLAVIPLLGMFNDMRFDSRFIDTVDPKPYWSSNAVSDFFHREPGHFRVMNLTKAVGENYLPQFDIPVVTGYHGNQLRWFDKLLGGPGAPNQANPNLLNLASARYLLLPSGQQVPSDYFGKSPVTEAANFGPVKAYRNNNALPRVYLLNQFRVFDNLDSLDRAVLEGANVFRDTVYLEQTPRSPLPDVADPADSAWVTEYEPDSVTVAVNAVDNEILVLTDNYYDPWQAFVDGKPAEIMRAYGAFRAVEIPAGSKEIIFKYVPNRYKTGKTITLLTGVYLLLVVGAFFTLRNRFTASEQ